MCKHISLKSQQDGFEIKIAPSGVGTIKNPINMNGFYLGVKILQEILLLCR